MCQAVYRVLYTEVDSTGLLHFIDKKTGLEKFGILAQHSCTAQTGTWVYLPLSPRASNYSCQRREDPEAQEVYS